MLGLRLSKLIEQHSDALAEGLVDKLYRSERTAAFHNISRAELKRDIRELYGNLTEWLIARSENEVEGRFVRVGHRRKEQSVPLRELIWALLLSKEHLWRFLQLENTVDGALQLFGTLEFLHQLDFFFDRGIYYATVGYEEQFARVTSAA